MKIFSDRILMMDEQVQELKNQNTVINAKIFSIEKPGKIDMDKLMQDLDSVYASKASIETFTNLLESYKIQSKPIALETQVKELIARIVPMEEQLRTKIDGDIFDDEI